MLFTTATFALLFLPLVLAGYYALGRVSHWGAALWLFLSSVFFYGYWMPEFTLLLLGSIVTNFLFAQRIAASATRAASSRAWLVAGVAFNLGMLAYFKYANFFVDNLTALLGIDWHFGRVILPIGISFYAFTQIAYLADTWSGKVNEGRAVHYGLFVTYFPHLIAGPVLHHAQMMPQFADPAVYRYDGARFWGGLSIFALGLVKKVVLADGMAPYADAVFAPVDAGASPSQMEAWLAAFAYTFQLYFDFSGYSDMAIGLSWMFNIRLPFNFDSPYKSVNISEFWRRWHISLSTFLRDYLYVPLGGNRRGPWRRYANLLTTMILGGFWHGASWSFVLWGGLHGAYLVVNHGFVALTHKLGWSSRLSSSKSFAVFGWAATFLSVVLAWVMFRAQTIAGATRMCQALVGLSSQPAEGDLLLWNAGLQSTTGWAWCLVLGGVSVLMPNSNRIGSLTLNSLRGSPGLQSFVGGAALAAALGLILLNTARDSVSAFIYFNF